MNDRLHSATRSFIRSCILTFPRHTAPVWQLAWAHPSFGSILASCSYDGRVFIWKEVGLGAGKGTGGEVQDGWERIKEHSLHTASVNSIAWAPYELGPILACASSDGKTSVINFQNDGSTDASVFPAHGTGANAISWAPSVPSVSAQSQNQAGSGLGPQGQGQPQAQTQKRFVSAGSDNLIKIWAYDEEAKKWTEEETIKEHEDWVRDVAWAPNIGLPGMYIASASQVCHFVRSIRSVLSGVGFMKRASKRASLESSSRCPPRCPLVPSSCAPPASAHTPHNAKV